MSKFKNGTTNVYIFLNIFVTEILRQRLPKDFLCTLIAAINNITFKRGMQSFLDGY